MRSARLALVLVLAAWGVNAATVQYSAFVDTSSVAGSSGLVTFVLATPGLNFADVVVGIDQLDAGGGSLAPSGPAVLSTAMTTADILDLNAVFGSALTFRVSVTTGAVLNDGATLSVLLADSDGGLLLNPNGPVLALSVAANGGINAGGFGPDATITPLAAVPEPRTWLTAAGGLLLMALSNLRRR